MHELGIVIEIIRIAERRAREEKATRLRALCCRSGSSQRGAAPGSVLSWGGSDTLLSDTELRWMLPANAICRNCKGTMLSITNISARYVKAEIGSRFWEGSHKGNWIHTRKWSSFQALGAIIPSGKSFWRSNNFSR